MQDYNARKYGRMTKIIIADDTYQQLVSVPKLLLKYLMQSFINIFSNR